MSVLNLGTFSTSATDSPSRLKLLNSTQRTSQQDFQENCGQLRSTLQSKHMLIVNEGAELLPVDTASALDVHLEVKGAKIQPEKKTCQKLMVSQHHVGFVGQYPN